MRPDSNAKAKRYVYVCLNEQTIEVYSQPHFTGYGSKAILRAGDKASPHKFPDVMVDVAELLKR